MPMSIQSEMVIDYAVRMESGPLPSTTFADGFLGTAYQMDAFGNRAIFIGGHVN